MADENCLMFTLYELTSTSYGKTQAEKVYCFVAVAEIKC